MAETRTLAFQLLVAVMLSVCTLVQSLNGKLNEVNLVVLTYGYFKFVCVSIGRICLQILATLENVAVSPYRPLYVSLVRDTLSPLSLGLLDGREFQNAREG